MLNPREQDCKICFNNIFNISQCSEALFSQLSTLEMLPLLQWRKCDGRNVVTTKNVIVSQKIPLPFKIVLGIFYS